MKHIFKFALAFAAILVISGCEKKEQAKTEAKPKVAESKPMIPEYSTLDAPKVCDIKANGMEKVLGLANKYNAQAIEKGLEFRRLGVNNSALIASIEEGVKTGATEVNPKDFKGKTSKTKLEINYAAQRACIFSIRALQQADEAKTAWRQAVPGDGYKF